MEEFLQSVELCDNDSNFDYREFCKTLKYGEKEGET